MKCAILDSAEEKVLVPSTALSTFLIWSNYSDLVRPGPPKGSILEGKWDSGYFREMEVGESL